MSKKFDVVIGNPPYQEGSLARRTRQVYPYFMDSAYSIGTKVCLITPGRFLFNAGGTSIAWNQKMLNDDKFKLLKYYHESKDVFTTGVDIKGGVAVTYRDSDAHFKPIGLFVPYDELVSVLDKLESYLDVGNFSELINPNGTYSLSDKFKKDCSKDFDRVKGETVIATNIFETLPDVFMECNGMDGSKLRVYGRISSQGRIYRCVDEKYINIVKNHHTWRVLLPKSNGTGAMGERLSSPMVFEPGVAHTETFISVGSFAEKDHAVNALKYIKTKFTRALLGVLKITQHNTPKAWAKVPLQDFTEDSDIDWSKSISEIDQQLYEKYNLNEEEINFIETNVKEMD